MPGKQQCPSGALLFTLAHALFLADGWKLASFPLWQLAAAGRDEPSPADGTKTEQHKPK